MKRIYMRMILGLLLLKLSLSSWLLLVVGLSEVQPGCSATYGNLTVHYPFGIEPRCAANDWLDITWNYTYNPPWPFLTDWSLKIVSTSESEVRIRNYLSYTCYDSSGQRTNYSNGYTKLSGGETYSSYKRNKFISVGCDTSAIIKGANGERYTSGNPYLEHGCQDINVYEDPQKHSCIGNDHCNNTVGSCTCLCPHGKDDDGLMHGKGCNPKRRDPTAKISLGFGLGILLLLTVTFWLYSGLHKRKLAKLKERYFKQNRGLLLQQHQLSLQKSGSATRRYTAEELQKATNNYNESQIVGRGGNGTACKGVLPPDNKLLLSSWLFLLIASPAANAAVELSGVQRLQQTQVHQPEQLCEHTGKLFLHLSEWRCPGGRKRLQSC